MCSIGILPENFHSLMTAIRENGHLRGVRPIKNVAERTYTLEFSCKIQYAGPVVISQLLLEL